MVRPQRMEGGEIMTRSRALPLSLALCLTTLCSCSYRQQAEPPVLDQGGVSVDLSKIGRETVQIVGEDLMRNGGFEELDEKTGDPKGWHGGFHVHTPDAVLQKKLITAIGPVAKRAVLSTSPAQGKNYIWLSTPVEANIIRGGKEPLMSNYYSINQPLPQLAEPTKFLLSFKYKGKTAVELDGLNSITMGVECLDGGTPPKATCDLVLQSFPASSAWKEGSITFLAPKETSALRILPRLYGCGEAAFDDLQLHKAVGDGGVSVRLIPFSFIDNVFCLSTGDPGILTLSCRNEKGVTPTAPVIHLELPEHVKLLEPKMPMKLKRKTEALKDGKPYVDHIIEVGSLKDCFDKKGYGTWNSLAFLLRTSLPPGGEFAASYWYEDGDNKSEPTPFTIRVITPVKAKTPKLFETGAVFAREADYAEKETADVFASFYTRLGFNAVHMGGTAPKLLKALAEKGVRRYCQPFWLCNGYRIGQEPKPDGAKFLMADGSSFKDGGIEAVCPVEVYTEGEYFKKHVVKPLRKILVEDRTADAIMPNWEPYMFNGKGCFCAKCEKEFATYAGMTENEVRAMWPAKVATERRDKLIAFRSWQHGKLMTTLERTVNALGKEAKVDAHFVPEIAWSSLTEKDNIDFAQSNPVDYLDKLPVVEPWGPYLFSSYSKPYEYFPGIHLITFAAAKENQDFIARRVKEPSQRPRIIAFPHGLQCDEWVTEPEAIAFDTLCFFLRRWNGSLVYYFPRGYDARYWNALAVTNTLIADYEDFVFKGTEFRGFSIKMESIAPPAAFPDRWDEGGNFVEKLPALKNNPPIVQAVGYELGGKRMIAIGNFWQKGEAFVRLSFKGLPDNQTYALWQPQTRHYFMNKYEDAALTANDLRDGVLVHVGALRFSFFVLEPYNDDTDYGDPITPTHMEVFRDKRLPEIIKADVREDDLRAKQEK